MKNQLQTIQQLTVSFKLTTYNMHIFSKLKKTPLFIFLSELAAASLLDLALSLVDLGCVLNEDGILQEIPVPPAPPIEPSLERTSACPPELALGSSGSRVLTYSCPDKTLRGGVRNKPGVKFKPGKG